MYRSLLFLLLTCFFCLPAFAEVASVSLVSRSDDTFSYKVVYDLAPLETTEDARRTAEAAVIAEAEKQMGKFIAREVKSQNDSVFSNELTVLSAGIADIIRLEQLSVSDANVAFRIDIRLDYEAGRRRLADYKNNLKLSSELKRVGSELKKIYAKLSSDKTSAEEMRSLRSQLLLNRMYVRSVLSANDSKLLNKWNGKDINTSVAEFIRGPWVSALSRMAKHTDFSYEPLESRIDGKVSQHYMKLKISENSSPERFRVPYKLSLHVTDDAWDDFTNFMMSNFFVRHVNRIDPVPVTRNDVYAVGRNCLVAQNSAEIVKANPNLSREAVAFMDMILYPELQGTPRYSFGAFYKEAYEGIYYSKSMKKWYFPDNDRIEVVAPGVTMNFYDNSVLAVFSPRTMCQETEVFRILEAVDAPMDVLIFPNFMDFNIGPTAIH